MKKILSITLLSLCTVLGAAGQSIYHLPETALTVEVTVSRETVRRGPYARFAQQYLGAVAALSDKEMYAVATAALTATVQDDPSAVYVGEGGQSTTRPAESQGCCGSMAAHAPMKTMEETPSFDGLTADRMEAGNPALETAAETAARDLFTLRRRRFDLITGEAGENVYGAGLAAALAEMKRLEDEYTALFLGRRTLQTIVKTFTVVPRPGTTRVIVCRFSEEGGVLPTDDLSGRPIVLELAPEEAQAAAGVAGRAPGKDARTFFTRVPDRVRCRVLDDKTVLADELIPVYQFGQTIEVAAGGR